MANSTEIDRVVDAFALWRNNRSSRCSPAPQALRKQTIDLLEHYSCSKVASMLRLSGSQVKQWRESFALNQTHPDFIHLPVQGEGEPIVNQHPLIELRLSNGAALSFSGEVSLALLVAMIQEAKS